MQLLKGGRITYRPWTGMGEMRRGESVCLALVVVAALAMGSCASLRRLAFEAPTIRLEAVEINALGFSGGSLTLLIEVDNPNAYDIRTTRVEAMLELEDTHFGTASLDEAFVLRGAASTTVEVPVDFTWEGVGVAARALFERGSVNYALDSRFWIDVAPESRTLSFRTRGRADLIDLVR